MEGCRNTRSGFDGSLRVGDLVVGVISISTMTDSQIDAFLSIYNRFGFCVIGCNPRDNPRDDLLGLSTLFGRVAPHVRADRFGVLSVDPARPLAGFIGSTSDVHPPHTDGAFSQRPETVFALQCEVAAEDGGESVLSSGKAAYDLLVSQCPQDLLGLHLPDAIKIRRKQQVSSKPVFRWVEDHIEMVFRSDGVAEIELNEAAKTGFSVLRDYFNDPQNQLTFSLRPYQILVADNTALVHGRRAFSQSSHRKYNRLNFFGDGVVAKELEAGFRPARL